MSFMLRTIILLGLSTIFATPAAVAGPWDVVKIGGRNYVTTDSIGRFYNLGSPRHVDKGFVLRRGRVSLQGKKNSRIIHINGRVFHMSFPTEVDSRGRYCISQMDVAKLLDPVMRPNRIRGADRVRTVILDPGHGGHDRGARSRYGDEKTYVLDTARRAKRELEKRGYNVILTRNSDVFIPLHQRATIADRYKDAIFISIHYNAARNTGAAGVEVYTIAPRGTPATNGGAASLARQKFNGNRNDELNVALATTMQNCMLRAVNGEDRGVKRARFRVLRDAKVPGVLVECGFLSNRTEARKVHTTKYRQKVAEAIARGVDVYQAAIGARSGPQAVSR
jgi:N-acetylmuramoyl-L-alanine amidase